MVAQRIDALLARGNTSDVLERGSDAVVKVLRPSMPEHWAHQEARTTALVHETGLPVPTVFDTTSVAGRPAIVFERIEGPTMLDQMVAVPGDVPRLSSLLARLQCDINATTAPDGLPTVRSRLTRHLAEADGLSVSERKSVGDKLNQLPEGNALCHFDIHPNNVILSPRGPVVIDWFDACAGDPDADVARSSVLMRTSATVGHLSGGDARLISSMHDEYLGSALSLREPDCESLLAWEEVVLAGRLAEPLVPSQRDDTVRALRAKRSGMVSTLQACLDS